MTRRCPFCGTTDVGFLVTCKKCNCQFCDECGETAAQKQGRSKTWDGVPLGLEEKVTMFIPICPKCGTDSVAY